MKYIIIDLCKSTACPWNIKFVHELKLYNLFSEEFELMKLNNENEAKKTILKDETFNWLCNFDENHWKGIEILNLFIKLPSET